MWKVDRSYRMDYETVDTPFSRYIMLGRRFKRSKEPNKRYWHVDIWGLFFDGIDGIFTGFTAWDASCFPSYASALVNLWNNLCLFLTPFYRPRRALLEAVIDNNGMKLLHHNRKSAYLRNRSRDVTYCDIRCGWCTATVKTVRYVDPRDGGGVCTFAHSEDGTTKVEKTVSKGLCLTYDQCDRLLKKIVEATPELEWWEPNQRENT